MNMLCYEQSISKTYYQVMSWLQEVEQRSDGKSQVKLLGVWIKCMAWDHPRKSKMDGENACERQEEKKYKYLTLAFAP